jgi:hypothetical protein
MRSSCTWVEFLLGSQKQNIFRAAHGWYLRVTVGLCCGLPMYTHTNGSAVTNFGPCLARESRCADVCNVACTAEALKSQSGRWQQLAICQLGIAQCQEALGRYDAAIQQCNLVTSTAQKAAEPRRLLIDAHLCRFRVRKQPVSPETAVGTCSHDYKLTLSQVM